MSEKRQRAHWTRDAYIAWQATQPVRRELVDNEVHAMSGGTAAHDRIANTLRSALTARLPRGAAVTARARHDGADWNWKRPVSRHADQLRPLRARSASGAGAEHCVRCTLAQHRVGRSGQEAA